MYCSFISICAVINEDFNVVSRSIQGFVGGVAILPCAPPTSTPKPNIRWVRRGSGNKVPDSSEVLPSGDLYLHSLSAGDSGQYRCVVVNTVLQEKKRGPYLTLNVSSEWKPLVTSLLSIPPFVSLSLLCLIRVTHM